MIDLDEFLLPMVLTSDAVVSDGELRGELTEGALVALAPRVERTPSLSSRPTRGSPSCPSTRTTN